MEKLLFWNWIHRVKWQPNNLVFGFNIRFNARIEIIHCNYRHINDNNKSKHTDKHSSNVISIARFKVPLSINAHAHEFAEGKFNTEFKFGFVRKGVKIIFTYNNYQKIWICIFWKQIKKINTHTHIFNRRIVNVNDSKRYFPLKAHVQCNSTQLNNFQFLQVVFFLLLLPLSNVCMLETMCLFR